MFDLDATLKDLGQCGWYQVYSFTLLLFPMILSGFKSTEYMFTTMDIPHRCRIPECEGLSGPVVFSPPWLSNAIPFDTDQQPAVCLRYRPLNNYAVKNNTSCPAERFMANVTEKCDDWVYQEPISTIATEFGITCPEDYWKRTLLSSVPVLTNVVGLFFTGFLSDRFGRKAVLVISSLYLSVLGLLKSFSSSYFMLAALETLSGFTIDIIFNNAFVLGLESLASDKLLVGSMVLNMFFTAGEVVLALDMWLFENWRLMIRAFYIPMLAAAILYWFLSESVRWLYVKNRYQDLEVIFRKVAKMNRTEDKLPEVIKNLRASMLERSKDKKNVQECGGGIGFGDVLKSQVIMWRMVVCSIGLLTSAMVSFGTTQLSVYFEGNRYLSFIFICLVELPSYIITGWLPAWKPLGRRGCLVWSFFLTGVTYIVIYFITPDQVLLNLVVALVGKFFSTFALTVNIFYMTELFPTEARSSLVSICCTIACLGIIFDQQIPIIELYVSPNLVFAASSIITGAIFLTCPETLGTSLPDTILEAEQLGKYLSKDYQTNGKK